MRPAHGANPRQVINGASARQEIQLVELAGVVSIDVLGPVGRGKQDWVAPVVQRLRGSGQQLLVLELETDRGPTDGIAQVGQAEFVLHPCRLDRQDLGANRPSRIQRALDGQQRGQNRRDLGELGFRSQNQSHQAADGKVSIRSRHGNGRHASRNGVCCKRDIGPKRQAEHPCLPGQQQVLHLHALGVRADQSAVLEAAPGPSA
ncbi:MAG TPA: hypothetical protein ACQGQH_06020 [Xylella sp.]